MTYAVKEIFYTLQGEGAHAGRPAVFCRFAGCNLWTGREQDRVDAVCKFCDTDFVGTDGTAGGKYATAQELAQRIAQHWPSAAHDHRFVVCTGGEPLLQLDRALIDALHAQGFMIAVETNGTIAAPDGIDWVCVSPKGNAPVIQTCGNELKLVYPQPELDPMQFAQLQFAHFLLQPKDGSFEGDPAATRRNTQAAIAYCQAHPQWRLSVQTHKVLGIR